MDYTAILTTIITLITIVITGLITKQLVPWLKNKNLYDAAVVAVNAAEALNYLKEKGFDIDSSRVKEALSAAWKEMDRAMYESGEKTKD